MSENKEVMMNNRRFFGKTTISLSPITLGTMRFSPERIGSKNQALSLLQYLYEQGVNTYHTSHEYDTHAFFCETFKQFKKKNYAIETTHIVKLAAPHFEETDFSPIKLEKAIDAQLQELGIEQIDIVQWLVRQKNNIDAIRIPKLIESASQISESFNKLIQSGKVRAFACFPYSLAFAEAVNKHHLVDGFIDYLNVAERQWADLLQYKTMINSGFIGIRPLFAGKLLKWVEQKEESLALLSGKKMAPNDLVEWALSYPLLNPQVASIILSISDMSQANLAIKAGKHSCPAGNNTAFIDTTHFMTTHFNSLEQKLT